MLSWMNIKIRTAVRCISIVHTNELLYHLFYNMIYFDVIYYYENIRIHKLVENQ